jgi:type II secretory pathway component PulK
MISRPCRRKGMILILVLVVIAALALAALTYSEMMFTEREAVEIAGRQAQAKALAQSGVELARVFLGQDQQTRESAGGCYNNSSVFGGKILLEDDNDRGRGRVTVLTADSSDGTVRYGLDNDSARLNLNTVLTADKAVKGQGRKMLMNLPGMSEEIADAILDWMDTDNTTREYGAEQDFYSALSPAYAPRNGPIQSLDELLLVRGVTRELLYGSDTNQNGSLDSSESSTASGTASTTGTVSTEMPASGWTSLLTLYSRESNLRSDGKAKIDVNQQDLNDLKTQLEGVLDDASWIKYILAYRQQEQTPPNNNPPKPGDPPPPPPGPPDGELDLSKPGNKKLSTLLDLIGGEVRVTFKGQRQASTLKSPFTSDQSAMSTYLPKLMGNLATNTSKTISGRININLAPEAVLLCLPGMTSDKVQQIISRRPTDPSKPDASRSYEAWPLAEGVVTLPEMKVLLSLVTTGGDAYRAQVVGYFDRDGPSARVEVVLDATKSPPAVLFWRDMSRLGRGYDLATLGVEGSGN